MSTKMIKQLSVLGTTSLILLACGTTDETTNDTAEDTEEVEVSEDDLEESEPADDLDETNESFEDEEDQSAESESDEIESEEEVSEDPDDDELSDSEGLPPGADGRTADGQPTRSPEPTGDELKTHDNPHMSELIDYSSDELKAYNEGIITHSGQKVEGQQVPEHFLEELMLPGVHENTEVYEGFAGTDNRTQEPRNVSLYLNEYDPAEMDPIASPDTDEEGYFVVDFTDIDVSEGDLLYFSVTSADLATQGVADVEVSAPSEGMGHIYLR